MTRHGINEESRLMNLSLGLWSKENDKFKIQIKLNDAIDNQSQAQIIYLTEAISKSFKNNAMIEVLLASLIDKGMFSEEDIEQIREKSHDRVQVIFNKISQVEDIDATT